MRVSSCGFLNIYLAKHTNNLLKLEGPNSQELIENMSYIVSLFTLKKLPKASEVKVGEKEYKKANFFLLLGICFILIAICLGWFRAIDFFNKMASVNQSSLPMLLLSMFVVFVFNVISFINFRNTYVDYVKKDKQKPLYAVIRGVLVTIFFSFYISLWSLNELKLAGKYNEDAHQEVCTIYTVNGGKSDSCINYENEMEKDKSFKNRYLLFLFSKK